MTDVDALACQLEERRTVEAAHRADELERTRAEAVYRRARADVELESRLADLDRAECEADAIAQASLGRTYRETRSHGERTRVAALVEASGEARALRLRRLRSTNLRVLVPVLLGFGAWSTTGVQDGAARLMGATTADASWWVLWLLEPVLIALVVWVIIARARLAAAGGRMARGAERVAAAALGVSIILNALAALPGGSPAGGWTAGAVAAAFGAVLAHVIGPVGAAATAHMIGVIDGSVSAADPWTESGRRVPLLAELVPAVERVPSPFDSAPAAVVESAVESGPVESAPARAAAGRARERAAEGGVRDASDADLRDRLDTLTASGELSAEPSVRQVQAALNVGFARAKRVMALRDEMPGQTTVYDGVADTTTSADGDDRRLRVVAPLTGAGRNPK